ncbi:MAG: M23 family metallopeptidase [Bacteroidales bacterium]|nr:M23 family metallopeptidase [Bacteroidales bacterium]
MADKNYTFDPYSLTYKKDEQKRGKRILIRILTQFFATIFIGVLVFLAISYTIKTPRLGKITEENQFMQQELERVKEKYNQANDLLKQLKARDKEIYRSVYETELAEEEPEGDKRLQSLRKAYPDRKSLLKAMNIVADSIVSKTSFEQYDFDHLKQIMYNSEEALPYIPCIMPIVDEAIEHVYYGFGQKLDPIYKTPQIHNGIDIAAKTTTQVIATADGVVESVGENRDNGKYIILNHKNGYKTLYAHLNDYSVKKNQTVTRSSVIGFVGNSGKSLTPHLHYGVSYNGRWLNPIHYFFADIKDIKDFKLLKKKVQSSGLSLD